MKALPSTLLLILAAGAFAYEESNESPAVLKDAERQVQTRLEEFTRSDRLEALAEARKFSFSLNPRQREGDLSPLDEGSLRLQLKVLLAVQAARDPHYDPSAPENIVYLNVPPPLTASGQGVTAGMDPAAMQDPTSRKAYQEAIAANHRRNVKSRRELELSRGVDYGVISIWRFTRGLAEKSPARTRAFAVIAETVRDEKLRERLLCEASPGLTR